MVQQRKIQVDFPVYSMASAPNQSTIAVGGGGGPNRSGIKNMIALYSLKESLELIPLTSIDLSKEEDGCMSVALHPKNKVVVGGINSSEEKMKLGQNVNCRLFNIQEKSIAFERGIDTVKDTTGEHYQKCCCFSPDGKTLATASTQGRITLLSWPSLNQLVDDIDIKDEVMDLNVDGTSRALICCTRQTCSVISLSKGTTTKSLANPLDQYKCEFRACRFGKGATAHMIFLVLNAKAKDRAFISKYRVIEKSPKESPVLEFDLVSDSYSQVSRKPISSFAISECGLFMAYGCSDLSVSIADARTFSVLRRFGDAHSFPVTALVFDYGSKALVSGSADSTLRVYAVPDAPKGSFLSLFTWIVLAIIASILFITMALEMPEEQDL